MGVLAGFVVVLLFVYPGVGSQHGDDTLFLLSGDDRWMMLLNRYPFRFVLDLLPIAFLQHIVPVFPAIEGVMENDGESVWVPLIDASSAVSIGD